MKLVATSSLLILCLDMSRCSSALSLSLTTADLCLLTSSSSSRRWVSSLPIRSFNVLSVSSHSRRTLSIWYTTTVKINIYFYPLHENIMNMYWAGWGRVIIYLGRQVQKWGFELQYHHLPWWGGGGYKTCHM